ncbi:MAG: hypothetical protein P8R04_00150 [Gammaproteobacteria bacterium]|nr:hypothetical protein [Gammaproteobacteria bacterium]
MRRLYIHIGYNKTGTTALQNFLKLNRVKFIERGFLYPTYGTADISAHHRFAAPFCRTTPAHFDEGHDPSYVIENVMDELKASGASTMIISTEMIVFYADCFPDKIKQLLEQFDEVKLIAYLRRQDDYIHSYYNSAIRNGRCATGFNEFVSGINLDYFDNLIAWETLFGEGNIIVRPYESENFSVNSIYSDFLSLLGQSLDSDLQIPTERPNEALSKPMVYMLRELNRSGISNHQQFLNYLRNFLHSIDDIPEAPEYFSRSARLEMLNQYRDSNLKVAERFGDGEVLFSETVRDNIGDEGSYDKEVRQLLSQLIVKQWNESGVAGSHNSTSLIRRIRERVKRLLFKSKLGGG